MLVFQTRKPAFHFAFIRIHLQPERIFTMSTFKQIRANRRNAQKCTGPKTEQGKAISSMNALKAGIDVASELMKQESQADFEKLIDEYYAQFPPANAIERALLNQLIRNEWLSRRYAAVESRAFEERFHYTGREDMGNAFLYHADSFVKLDRMRNSAQRNYQRAMKELLALRQARNAEMPVRDYTQPQPQPEPPAPFNPELVSFENFPETPALQSQPSPEIPKPNEQPLTFAA